MARSVDIAGDELHVRLTRLQAIAALKRELRITLAAIRSVSVGAPRKLGLRIGGTDVPFTGIRAGRFRSQAASPSFPSRSASVR